MTTKPSIWTDTPPKEPGGCYVKGRHSGLVFISNTAQLRDPEHYQFGPRIPPAEELAGLYAAAAELAQIKRAWGMGATKEGA